MSKQPAQIRITRRVLVADDDEFYRNIAIASLHDAGYDVTAAANGEEALELIAAMSPDIAIIDVIMPGVSGIDIIHRIRSSGPNRNLPIVVITGNDDTESIERAYDAGATSFLAKPLNWPLFVQHVNFVLKAAQAELDLRDAIRTAEFLSDLKSRVVSVLVGEFQAPLRTAQGMAELLRKEVYGPLGHRLYLEYAEDLHKALDQLNSIQLKMMNSSRIMSAELLLKEEDVPLKDSVVEAIHAMRAKGDRRGIAIEFRDSLPAGLLVRGDRSLLNQAFKMLIESAIATSPRNSEIMLDAHLDQEGGFFISIRDSAPALPDTMIRDVLGTGPVARPVAQQLSISRGTSLTISRVVAEAHDGKLLLNSTIGEGTIVRLALPKTRLAIAAPATQPAAVIAHDASLPSTPPPVLRPAGNGHGLKGSSPVT
jgi:two-component system, sensor histidine kinase and response regulator